MRYTTLGGIIMAAWIGAWPMAAHADYLSSARASLKKGDLKSAQIDLRNAVRSDPQNAEAHYWLGKVALELGDPVAAEREAIAARDRGYDPHQAVPLLSQALLAQGKYDDLLAKLKPEGKDASLDAAILVARGYAQIGQRKPDEAEKSFADAEQVAPNAVEPLLAHARLAVARADLNKAQQMIDRAIAAQPKSPEALLAKSQLLRLKNDGTGAMAVLDELIHDQPSVVQARLDRASLALALGKNDLARGDINTVLKDTPGNVQAIYLQAVMEAQSRDYNAADKDLEHISAYIGRIQRAFYLQAVVKEQLGQYEQAEEAAKKYLGRAPNDLAAYKILARIQFAKRRPDQVIDTLAKVAESGKADSETYDLLGRAYAATNQPDAAVNAFQKAETLAPNDVGLQTRLASVRMTMGQPDAAMGDLEHTLELAPKMPAVGEALFFASLATGDMTKAADALAKVKAAQGDTDVTQNLTGLFKLSQIDLPGARDVFSATITKYPNFAPARINLARVLAMMGDRDAAEKILAELLAKQPTTEPALSMLASSYTQNGRLPQAIALLEAAHAADPKNLRVLASLGDLYIRNGTAQKALDLVNQQKDSIASTTEVLSLKAAAQLALGQKQEARDTYSAILKADPSVIGARRQLEALLLEIGDFESARNVVKEGITISPRNYQLYQDLAIIDLKSTGVDAALATAERLAGQDRDYIALRGLKGDVYMAANRPEDAANAYSDALAGASDSGLVTRLATAQLRTRKPEAAIKTLTDWLAKHSDDMVAMEQLSEIDIALGKLDDAAKALETVLADKPHNAVALNNLAWVYQQQKNPKAQSLARQAYVLAPGPQTADTLGWIMTSAGNAGTGVSLLRQANAESTTDPRVQYHYAVALKDTGNKDEALKMLNAVVAVKGTFPEKTDAQKLLDDMNKGL
jgi:putative PEP-CTERM system TPR-repeat lipoprotein